LKVFLTVVFLVNGHPTVIDGWLPREQPDDATCLARMARLLEYLPQHPGLPEEHDVACVAAPTPLDAAEWLAAAGKPL